MQYIDTSTKQLLYLQLFTRPKLDEVFNLLFIGDTDSSKTYLMNWVKSFYMNSSWVGRNTSQAGLTGAVKGNRLVGGAVNSIENGIMYIDELDKLPSKIRKTMLQLLENYGTTITKSGYQFNIEPNACFTSTANPKGGRWYGKVNKSQLPFRPEILSRFHTTIPFESLDYDEYDKLKQSYRIKGNKEQKQKNIKKLKKRLDKAKKYKRIYIPSKISDWTVDLIRALAEEYGNYLPRQGNRQIEGVLSLLRACARMHRRDEVKEEDFENIKAIYLNVADKWTPNDVY